MARYGVVGQSRIHAKAMACVEFNRGKYSNSLEMYKRVLQVYPRCPAAVRLGIGLCRFKLGQFERAKQAFERLDPENVEALVALGIVDLQSNEASGIRRAMEKMQRAFDVYPYCATALNYLANHFFFTGQHFLVEQLTETALAATTHGSTRAHSYYNLARSYHSKGDYEKAGLYYMASVKEVNKPQEFILPFYGLGQVQLKLGDFKSSLSNFEKAVAHIYLQLNQTTKAHEALKKAVRIVPHDPEAFLDLGESFISTDSGAALEAFKTARNLLKKSNEEVSVELLNNIGVLHFEKGEFELAEQTFKEALGDGIWVNVAARMYKDMQLFQDIEKAGVAVELPWDKITTLSNLARLFEQLHKTETASLLYRLILFKFPEYVDAYLRPAAIAKARNNVPLSIEPIRDALEVDDKNPDALCMLGDLELKNDDGSKQKIHSGQRRMRLMEKILMPLFVWGTGTTLQQSDLRKERPSPGRASRIIMAAKCWCVVLAEKGQFDVAKELFTQVQEAASGSVFVQIPDVWINLAHVHFSQGNFPLAIKMYQSCLRKFYYNTDSQILLYLARTHYEAEQWQDCKKTLLKAIHLAPSNYTLRFDTGVALQKFSASTLQKTKRTVDEVRATVAELKNAVRLFSQLSAATNLQIHGFDEKKIETHVGYCKHLLEAAKVHCDAVELEDQQNKHRLELARKKIGRVVGLSEKTGLKEMMRRADRVKRGKEKVIESEIVKKYGDGERRKRQRMAKGKSRPTDFDKIMRDKATSFFFTNFPDSWDSAALWKMFSRYGKVVDVYIAFKKTKKDTRFGFVRFINFVHLETFERRLKEILIGESRLVINRAKFFNGGNVVLPPSDFPPLKVSHKSLIVPTPSKRQSRLEGCWMGKAKNFQVLQNAWTILENNGLMECNVKYCGGLSFLFEWNSRETASKSLEANKIWLQQWFDDVKPWEEGGDDTGRLTWLNIEGLPALGRNVGAIKSVLNEFS
ncbi:protein CTR9 [Tanacetum coccineum]